MVSRTIRFILESVVVLMAEMMTNAGSYFYNVEVYSRQ